MPDVCPCHGEPWYLERRKSAGGAIRRHCSVKRREARRRSRVNNRPSERARLARRHARKQARRDSFGKKLGKLLNLSVNPNATPAERETALRMYHNLKARNVA